MAFGERIRQFRKEASWSQLQLGQKFSADSQRVSRYDKIVSALEAIVRIAEASASCSSTILPVGTSKPQNASSAATSLHSANYPNTQLRYTTAHGRPPS